MFAPIRPNPIIPSCMVASLSRCCVESKLCRAASPFRACPQRPIAADQCVRGTVVRELAAARAVELGQDALGEDLAELDTPLIERVDLPDHALREDAVLVQGDELAKRSGRQLLDEDRVRWA